MSFLIRTVQPGDEGHLAHIQTESWKAAFRDILSGEVLERVTSIDGATAMYRRLLEAQIGHGYLLEVDGVPHCMAWWDRSREEDRPDDAELICIHSLQENWRKGYGSRMMEAVLSDIRSVGYSKVMLWVFTDNHRARRFYESQGFVTSGKTKPCFDTEEICYEKEL